MPKCKKCDSENTEQVLDLLGEGKLYQCIECKTVFTQ